SASSRLIRRARRTSAVRDSPLAGVTTVLVGAPLTAAAAFLGATTAFFAAGAFLTGEAFLAAGAFLAGAVLGALLAAAAFLAAGVFFAAGAFFTAGAFFAAGAFSAPVPAGFGRLAPPSFTAAFVVASADSADSLPPSGPCSPTAESRRTSTRAAPSACALTGYLDTRPAYGPAPTSAPDPEDRRPIGPLPRTPAGRCGILVTDHTVWTVRQNGHHGPLVSGGTRSPEQVDKERTRGRRSA